MIFDTDVLVWALRGNARAADAIDQSGNRAISIVTLMELLQGARSKSDAARMRLSLRQLRFNVLQLSEAIGSIAATFIEEHALAHGIQLADGLIAATAIDAGQPLCTANVKHFRPVKSLNLVPFKP